MVGGENLCKFNTGICMNPFSFIRGAGPCCSCLFSDPGLQTSQSRLLNLQFIFSVWLKLECAAVIPQDMFHGPVGTAACSLMSLRVRVGGEGERVP